MVRVICQGVPQPHTRELARGGEEWNLPWPHADCWAHSGATHAQDQMVGTVQMGREWRFLGGCQFQALDSAERERVGIRDTKWMWRRRARAAKRRKIMRRKGNAGGTEEWLPTVECWTCSLEKKKMGKQSRRRRGKEVEKKVNMWTVWKLSSGARNVAWNLDKTDGCVKGISSVGAGEETPV